MLDNISLGELLTNLFTSQTNEGSTHVPLPAGFGLSLQGSGHDEHIRLTNLGDDLIHAKTGDDTFVSYFSELGEDDPGFHLAYVNDGNDGDLSLTTPDDSLLNFHTGEESSATVADLLDTNDAMSGSLPGVLDTNDVLGGSGNFLDTSNLLGGLSDLLDTNGLPGGSCCCIEPQQQPRTCRRLRPAHGPGPEPWAGSRVSTASRLRRNQYGTALLPVGGRGCRARDAQAQARYARERWQRQDGEEPHGCRRHAGKAKRSRRRGPPESVRCAV